MITAVPCCDNRASEIGLEPGHIGVAHLLNTCDSEIRLYEINNFKERLCCRFAADSTPVNLWHNYLLRLAKASGGAGTRMKDG